MKKPFYEEKNITLYHGDCLKLLKDIPDNSIDMIFADPPYFLSNGGMSCKSGKMVKVDKAEWDKSKGFDEDLKFNELWITECRRVLKEEGTIWISGTRHNIFVIGYLLQKLNFYLLNEISWLKPNAPPNLSCNYFTHAHETLLWARKNKNTSHKYNYLLMKNWGYLKDTLNLKGKQMKSVWLIPLTPPSEKLCGKHPTQKPLEVLKRVILSSTDKDDMILDPFNGAGTTGVICKEYKRKYIGIDLEREYLEITKKRLKTLS